MHIRKGKQRRMFSRSYRLNEKERERERVKHRQKTRRDRPDVKSGLISPASRHLVSSFAYQAGPSSRLLSALPTLSRSYTPTVFLFSILYSSLSFYLVLSVNSSLQIPFSRIIKDGGALLAGGEHLARCLYVKLALNFQLFAQDGQASMFPFARTLFLRE